MLGDHLRNKISIYGHPACINTAKCLLTAAEKGVDIESHFVDPATGSDSPDIRSISPLGSVPILKDVDLVVYGTAAIMSYLDDKGFGPSLNPRNAVVRASNYQWAHIATDYVQPQVTALMNGDGDRNIISRGFELLSEQLQTSLNSKKKGGFVCGEFSLADIHWAAVAHGCHLANAGDLVEANASVKMWWQNVKTHPSTSKEKIVAYEVLPTQSDVQSRQLNDIHINA